MKYTIYINGENLNQIVIEHLISQGFDVKAIDIQSCASLKDGNFRVMAEVEPMQIKQQSSVHPNFPRTAESFIK